MKLKLYIYHILLDTRLELIYEATNYPTLLMILRSAMCDVKLDFVLMMVVYHSVQFSGLWEFSSVFIYIMHVCLFGTLQHRFDIAMWRSDIMCCCLVLSCICELGRVAVKDCTGSLEMVVRVHVYIDPTPLKMVVSAEKVEEREVE